MSFAVITRTVCSGLLVRIARHRLEPGRLFSTGFVLARSETLVLLQILTDRIDLDGYEVLRTADITAATDRFPRQEFYARGLALKGIGPDREPPVEITDMPRAVASIGGRFPLVSISRERAHPDEIAVGRVCGVGKTGFALQWITPSAVLEERTSFQRFAGITRLQFGGEYERTLALVAGLSSVP